ncbi:hypothetical protein ACWGBX_04670 [Streptomyces sp. NPDC055037]
MTGGGCPLCERAAALSAVEPPGWVLRTAHWGISGHPAMPVPGWVAAQTLRHTEGLHDLDAAESAELGPLLTRLSGAVRGLSGSGRVYTYSLGEGCPHTHILLGPPSSGRRGAEFLTALLGRDSSLTDRATAARFTEALANELATCPPPKTLHTL